MLKDRDWKELINERLYALTGCVDCIVDCIVDLVDRTLELLTPIILLDATHAPAAFAAAAGPLLLLPHSPLLVPMVRLLLKLPEYCTTQSTKLCGLVYDTTTLMARLHILDAYTDRSWALGWAAKALTRIQKGFNHL